MELCPLCHKKARDMLKHLSIYHEVADINQYQEKLQKVEKMQVRREEFSKYVEELKAKIAQGLMSAEEYRKLIIEWEKNHS